MAWSSICKKMRPLIKMANKSKTLRILRLVPASPEKVFSAWTDPEALLQWWGPKGVRCSAAEIELRVGGAYRIANELPDGSTLWISGEFEVIERPHLLVYSWTVENALPVTECVSVRFSEHASGTQIDLTHEQIATEVLRDQHQQGWIGCLDGLTNFFRD